MKKKMAAILLSTVMVMSMGCGKSAGAENELTKVALYDLDENLEGEGTLDSYTDSEIVVTIDDSEEEFAYVRLTDSLIYVDGYKVYYVEEDEKEGILMLVHIGDTDDADYTTYGVTYDNGTTCNLSFQEDASMKMTESSDGAEDATQFYCWALGYDDEEISLVTTEDGVSFTIIPVAEFDEDEYTMTLASEAAGMFSFENIELDVEVEGAAE